MIARLLKEVDDGRVYVAKLEEREQALTDEIARADEAHEQLTEAYKASLLELGELRATIKYKKEALSERESQVERLRTELTQAREELKGVKKENRWLKVYVFARTVLDIIKIVHP